MKSRSTYIIILITFLLTVFSCSKKTADDSFTIEGRLDGLVASSQIHLASFTQSKAFIDTLNAPEGKFAYSGTSPSLQAITLYMRNDSIWTTVWVKNGDKIKISGNVNYPELLRVEGGEVNNLLMEFKNQNKDIIKKRQDLSEMIKSNEKEGLDLTLNEGLYAQVGQLRHQLKQEAFAFAEKHTNSIASLLLLYDYVLDYESADRILQYLDRMDGELNATELYQILKSKCTEIIQQKT